MLSVTSGSSGSGNGTVNYTVSSEAASSSRTGTITVAGSPIAIYQGGTVPTFTVATASGPYAGTVSLSATLKNGATNINGRTVTFFLNGTQVGTKTTSGGTATLSNVSLGGIALGTYPAAVTATFAGD